MTELEARIYYFWMTYSVTDKHSEYHDTYEELSSGIRYLFMTYRPQMIYDAITGKTKKETLWQRMSAWVTQHLSLK